MPPGHDSGRVETAPQPALTWINKQLEFEVVPIVKRGADTATLASDDVEHCYDARRQATTHLLARGRFDLLAGSMESF